MNILVVNDDGINAAGINKLVQALSRVADVYVFAPDGQRSAKSHSLTLTDCVYMTPVDFPGAVKAYTLSGTPADCTKFGLHLLADGSGLGLAGGGVFNLAAVLFQPPFHCGRHAGLVEVGVVDVTEEGLCHIVGAHEDRL